MIPEAVAVVALYAAGVDPDRAWPSRGWEKAPLVALSGVNRGTASPTTLQARWNNQWLFLLFQCGDDEVVSTGKTDGLDHFLLGDVVEVFLGRTDRDSYLEVHATPSGWKTVYSFTAYRQKNEAPSEADQIEVYSEKVSQGWRCLMAVPWTVLPGGPDNGRWQILAGRYDYGLSGNKPVLSSFPPQNANPDFHRRDRFAWLELRR